MTPEQQRIKIAEACGWTCCGCIEGCPPFGLHPMFNVKDYSVKQVIAMEVPIGDLPDYLNDLNAMHEAERTLTDNQRMHFRGELVEMMRPKYGFESACLMAIHATAKQRAKAFLRTLNLWKE